MNNAKQISLLALGAALAATQANAQTSLPTIEVGGAPLRATSRPPSPAPGHGTPGGLVRTAGPTTVSAPAPVLNISPIVTYAAPSTTHTVSARDLAETRQFDVSGTLQRQVPGVSINDVGGNPTIPEIDYRGFAASPIGGTPQGLAVYQGGVRINEAWGDAVNWDLIPSIAIDRLSVVTGNPLFGLNAIGGAITLDMKNGFTWQGFEIDGRGGSFGRRQGAMQYGVQSGPYAAYLAMEALGTDGYRHFSGAHVKRLYGDVGYQFAGGEIHANVTLAENRHGASGPAPEELIAIDPRAVYTTPQTYKNTLSMFDLNGVANPTPNWKLFGDAHYRAFDQARIDGNTTEFECEEGDAFCATEDGDPTHIPNYFDGQKAIGAIDRTWTRSRTIGGTVQATNDDIYFGFHNKITFGVSYDHGWTAFNANEEIGLIQPNLVVAGLGHIVDEPAYGVSSVNVRASNDYLGVYALDSLDLTDRLTVTAGARFNRAGIALYDLRGTTLNGNGVFTRVNPTAGLSYKLLPNVEAYGSYSEANRAPTPLELGCADPARPCLIDSFMVADPPLKQVHSNTVEVGLRGHVEPAAFGYPMLSAFPGRLDWSVGLYRTHNFDDILSVPSAINGRGYFTNAGATLRQGVETSLRYRDERMTAFMNYTLTDATFRDPVALGAPDNPLAIAAGTGTILVMPGSNLSSIPRHRFKAGLDYLVTPKWSIGGDLTYTSGTWLRGDEINQFGMLRPYALLNLRSSYQVTPNIQIYGLLENVANVRARSFGAFFGTTDINFLSFSNPRMTSFGPPIGAYGGVKLTF